MTHHASAQRTHFLQLVAIFSSLIRARHLVVRFHLAGRRARHQRATLTHAIANHEDLLVRSPKSRRRYDARYCVSALMMKTTRNLDSRLDALLILRRRTRDNENSHLQDGIILSLIHI